MSDVKVTRADGSVDIVPAYSHKEALKVVEAGELRKIELEDQEVLLTIS